jgi:hypothetical protein
VLFHQQFREIRAIYLGVHHHFLDGIADAREILRQAVYIYALNMRTL